MANFFKEYQQQVKECKVTETKETRWNKMYNEVWDALTDMSAAELLDFLHSNDYFDFADNIETLHEDLIH